MATAENWEEILRTNFAELLTIIDTTSGLLGELKKAKIFTELELKSSMDGKNQADKNDIMLRKLEKKDFGSFKKFCEALVNSGQENVVKKHMSNVQDVSVRQDPDTDGASNVSMPDNREISDTKSGCIKRHWNDLVLAIIPDKGLLSLIGRHGVFTKFQMTTLRDIDSDTKRTEQMLDWLERGSEKQLEDFKNALTSNNQHFIVTAYLTPKIRIPVRKSTESQIPESSLPRPHPSTIQEGQMRSQEARKVPEGRAAVFPLPIQVGVGNIAFSSCSPEFLDDYRAKILKKVAYKCDSSPRGRAVIMNNMFFTVNHLKVRSGSQVDTDNLQKLFESLDFDTIVYANKNAEDMWNIIVEESQESSHEDYDMFVLFLMSHGIKGEVYGIDGKPVKTADIVNQFNGINCPALLAKPKLFFIQACQGNVKTVGVVSTDSDSVTDCESAVTPVRHKEDEAMEQMLKKLSLDDDFDISIPLPPMPNFESDAVAEKRVHEMADMAIIYATVDGYAAWRRVDTGSLFVQCLINVINNRAHDTDLLRMITETNSKLHELDVVANQERYKQILDKRDTLRREVYLLPPARDPDGATGAQFSNSAQYTVSVSKDP